MKRKKDDARPVTSIEDSSASALRTLRQHLEFGEIEAALAVYKTSSIQISGWQPQPSDWVDLIQALLSQDSWGEAARVMLDYVRKAPEPSPRVRLKLGQILIQKLRAADAGARRAARNPGRAVCRRSSSQSARSSSRRPSTCVTKVSSSFRMNCGDR